MPATGMTLAHPSVDAGDAAQDGASVPPPFFHAARGLFRNFSLRAARTTSLVLTSSPLALLARFRSRSIALARSRGNLIPRKSTFFMLLICTTSV